MTLMDFREFYNLYYRELEPVLRNLEPERAKICPKSLGLIILMVILTLFGGAILLSIISIVSSSFKIIGGFVALLIPIMFACPLPIMIIFALIIAYKHNKLRSKFKQKIVTRILALYDDFYYLDSNKANVLPITLFSDLGLFSYCAKLDDDIIIGKYKDSEVVINECTIRTTGKNSTVYFKGLILRYKMNKKFNGTTIVVPNAYLENSIGLERVELEDVDFMENRVVYSSDQIEARYLLTTAFMERLNNITSVFSEVVGRNIVKRYHKDLVPDNLFVIFDSSEIYLFIPTTFDFFDLDLGESLLKDPERYYNIYKQLGSVLVMVDYFKLDMKLGL